MDKLTMHTTDLADEKYEKLAALFPNAITETIDENGNVVRAIDKDVLMQEINTDVVEGPQERYQFTWPDKREAIRLANAPIAKTLRLDREKSVGRDGTPGNIDTENIYIEGDNLDALKLLRETYMGKVKMIYIDPPYNTGNDFVYEDDFSQDAGLYAENSGQTDDEGNRLVQNTESNGRFHTDWLNMIYPRLKLAKDFLTDDGFISIDDNEQDNLCKICNEIFGAQNYVATFPWRKRTAKSDVPFGVSQDYEWVLCYAKSDAFIASIEGKGRKYYKSPDFPGKEWRIHDLTKQTTASERPNSFFTIINPRTGEEYPANPNQTWRITKDTFEEYDQNHRIVFPGDYDFLRISKPVLRYWKDDDMKKDGENFGKVAVSTKFPEDIGMSKDGTKEITQILGGKYFPFPKPSTLIKFLISIHSSEDDIIFDFFSGSATTAQAVMQLNAEDKNNRKFILVQLPELVDEKSEARKAHYQTICEIGKERIRRAGKQIKEETGTDIDYGFRVFKVDSSNMADVYYRAQDVTQEQMMEMFTENIKEGRIPEDLLFQSMLELGIPLSSPIEEITIDGKKVFSVEDGYLLACFDDKVSDVTITEIAKRQPFYAIFRDSSLENDAVMANFEQIFATYSPQTERKVL